MAGQKPSDFLVALAVSMYGPQFVVADEVRGKLNGFGFHLTAQQVATTLGRLSRKELPPIEVEDRGAGCWSYRLTQWGRNEIDNKTKGLQQAMGWIPAPPDGFEIRPKESN
jgi:hypothetical protein